MARPFLTQEDFIFKAQKVHGLKYKYTKSIYCGTMKHVLITCPIHGDFLQTPWAHTTLKRGCNKCRYKDQTINQKEFIQRSKEKYQNTFTYKNTQYSSMREPVIITCQKHGDFSVIASNHLRATSKGGCRECGKEIQRASVSSNTEQFIQRAIDIHGNEYSYSKVNYTHSNQKVIITCFKHGDFKQTATVHLSGHGCPDCGLRSSCGENKIEMYLKKFGFVYEKQKKFSDCRRKRSLPFDFFVPCKNLLIEYDGMQHFRAVGFEKGEEKLVRTQEADAIKTKYAKDNDINLLRISYTEFDKIEKKLKKELGIKEST